MDPHLDFPSKADGLGPTSGHSFKEMNSDFIFFFPASSGIKSLRGAFSIPGK